MSDVDTLRAAFASDFYIDADAVRTAVLAERMFKRLDTMTIRESLRNWFRFLGIGILGIGILAGSWRVHSWLNYYIRMAVLSFLLISVLGLFGFGFACPRCRKSLAMKVPKILDGQPFHCPKCGVNIDEPQRNPADP